MDAELFHFTERLMDASIPLKKLDKNHLPVGIASGCLIDYLGYRIILSVFHATKFDGNWAIELKYERGSGTKLFKPGTFHFLGEMTLGNPELRSVDFSYREVPPDIEPYFQKITFNGEVLSERPKQILKPDFNIVPSSDKTYGFAGLVMPEMHGGQFLFAQLRAYHSLKYIGDEGPYYIFETPIPHPGHEHFRGCSGAPILDDAGNAVALVCHGDISRNAIFGISLARYKFALDFMYGSNKNA